MREGLGVGWQAAIPPEMHRAFAQTHRTDLWGPLRAPAHPRARHARCAVRRAGGPAAAPGRLRPAAGGWPRPAIVVCTAARGSRVTKAPTISGCTTAGWRRRATSSSTQYRLSGRWPAPLEDVMRDPLGACQRRALQRRCEPDRADRRARRGAPRAAGGVHAQRHGLQLRCFRRETQPWFGDEVQAVVASYAPADLRLWPAEPGGAIEQLLGGLPDEIPERYAEASPSATCGPGCRPRC